MSVNDKVLLSQDIQDSILRHNFHQLLPKSINDKITPPFDPKDTKQGGGNGKQGWKQNQGNDGNKDKKETVVDQEKSHLHWRVRDNENFHSIFYSNQKKCPRTKEGKYICMKFFLRGFCEKSCTRAHKLFQEDEQAFDKFVSSCCKGGAGKPDF
jgi:hypothetical protein